MKIIHDYRRLLAELDVNRRIHSLSDDTMIQVLRGEPHPVSGYHAIIAWFFDHETMVEHCRILPTDNEYHREDKRMMWSVYVQCFPDLEKRPLGLVIQEMTENNIN